MDTNEDDLPQRLKQIAKCHDRMIKAEIDEEVDEVLRANLEQFQAHNCTFTCAKKRKTLKKMDISRKKKCYVMSICMRLNLVLCMEGNAVH